MFVTAFCGRDSRLWEVDSFVPVKLTINYKSCFWAEGNAALEAQSGCAPQIVEVLKAQHIWAVFKVAESWRDVRKERSPWGCGNSARACRPMVIFRPASENKKSGVRGVRGDRGVEGMQGQLTRD